MSDRADDLVKELRALAPTGWIHVDDLVKAAADEIERLRAQTDEIEGLDRAFTLMWEGNKRGIELWRTAHPDEAMTRPDQSRMIDWLVNEIERLRAQVVALQSSLDAGPPVPGKKTPDALKRNN